ncbi:MAG TPA: signal peptidase I [Nitrososphaerales archaeon]|nr:signal peptidase I [Nitrososphaerales archaeon]
MDKRFTKRRIAEYVAVVLVAVTLIGLPIYTQTSNYPLAIVQGNSMYPTLHNGDLVIFGRAPPGQIRNGTIIVFVQGDTGVTVLDSLVRPVVIHRIVGVVIQADGSVYYRTKGDNNQFVDPSLVQANHVLGVPMRVLPSVGILVIFFSSAQGLVALIGVLTLYYLGKYEIKLKEDERKNAFLGDLTRLSLEGELSQETFRLLEPVVKYGRGLQLDGSNDELVISLLGWMKKGGLEKDWKVTKFDCPRCSGRATSFVSSKDITFTICQGCTEKKDLPSAERADLEPEPVSAKNNSDVHRRI